MNPTILPPAIGKLAGQTNLFNLGMATGLGEGKFKPVVDLGRDGFCLAIHIQDQLHE